MLGLFPMIGAAFGLQHLLVMRAAGSALEATNEAGSVVSQALLNVRTVGALGLEPIARRNFAALLAAPLAQFVRKGAVTGMGMGFGQFIILVRRPTARLISFSVLYISLKLSCNCFVAVTKESS